MCARPAENASTKYSGSTNLPNHAWVYRSASRIKGLESKGAFSSVMLSLPVVEDRLSRGDQLVLWTGDNAVKQGIYACGEVSGGEVFPDFEIDTKSADPTASYSVELSDVISLSEPVIEDLEEVDRALYSDLFYHRTPGPLKRLSRDQAMMLRQIVENQFSAEHGKSPKKEDNSQTPENKGKPAPDYHHIRFSLDTASNKDLLGQDAFVEALGLWISTFWKEKNESASVTIDENSFMIHLHGRWGSGKSTVLNLLRKWLMKPASENEPWIVVHFNAWENAHMQPVWWPLLDQIYREGYQQTRGSSARSAFRLWFYDFRWKLKSGNTNLLILTGLFLLTTLLSGFFFGDSTAIITTAGAVLTGGSTLLYFIRSLFWGSAESADSYIKLSRDPLSNIKTYFKEVVARMERPVMVFIDDLDRCESKYVVDLLEDIQTLFNRSRVFYVIAADKRWIYSSFENHYGEFRNHIEEPGKQLGYLFIDKIFQLSIAVPRISHAGKKNFLNHLYELNEEEANAEAFGLAGVMNELEQAGSQAEVMEIVTKIGKEAKGINPSGKLEMVKQQSIRKMADPGIARSNEAFLSGFVGLLEPNPRSVKRLVNNYGIHSILAFSYDHTLIENAEDRSQFALWTIMKMRWPVLSDFLEEHPNEIGQILTERKSRSGGQKIDALLEHRDVKALLDCKPADGAGLSESWLQRVIRYESES